MLRWLHLVVGITFALIGAQSAIAQQPRRQQREQLPAEPPADRKIAPSRFSEERVATRLPPIVSKRDTKPRDTRASDSKAKDEPTLDDSDSLKLEPAFTPADPRDHSALLKSTTVIAVVGGYHIITGDLLGEIYLAVPELLNAPPEERENVEKALANYLRAFLGSSIELKMLYIDFMRQDHAKEIFAKVEANVAEKFEESIMNAHAKVLSADTSEAREGLKSIDVPIRRLADLMARENLSTIGELDVALNRYGTSLAKERRRYAERSAGFMMMHKIMNPKTKKEPTRDELLEYYQEHLIEFSRPARCKWEKLSVLHSKFNTRAEAREAIAQMGDAVYLGDAKFAAVARRSSQTADATDGGLHDWTGKDALRSDVLNKAIFSLDVGKLSDILVDDDGMHIIRVIERDDGGYEPFSEVKTQELIKAKITQAQQQKVRMTHFNKLKREIAVWNIFDELNEEEGQAGSNR